MLVSADPAVDLGTPKVERRLPVVLKEREVERLLESAGSGDDPVGLRDLAVIELLYATGMRVGELCGLRLADIDMTRPPCGSGARAPRSASCRSANRPRPRSRRGCGTAAQPWRQGGDRPAPGADALFFNRRARPLSQRDARGLLARHRTAAGVRTGTSPHTLRHSSRPTCSKVAPTCVPYRSCSAMRP